MKRVLVSWSSGKDSAWTLHMLSGRKDLSVVALLTTINQSFDRVAMHAVRHSLLKAQADALGLPLWSVPLPWPCSNAEYEKIMGEVCGKASASGIDAVAFGDLFLADVRRYRERQLEGSGLEPLFPLWQMPTRELAAEMIAAGLKAKITCVDPRHLPKDFAGRNFDPDFLAALPSNADPCGENGEFHSFVYDGPGFRQPVAVQVGDVVERDGFVFADLLEGGPAAG